MPSIETVVGPRNVADGALPTARSARTGELVVADAHGRFYEQNSRGNVYSDGIGLTAINNATYTTGTLGATCTPIAGIWNPTSNTVNLVVLRAVLGITLTALAATGGGPYVWALSTGNGAISTGNAPLNRKSLAAAGSAAKGMSNVALTGLTNNLVVKFGSSLFGGSAESVSFTATAVAMQTIQASSVEQFDGDLIVPPGAVLALLATTTPVAHSAVSAIVWEEVPV